MSEGLTTRWHASWKYTPGKDSIVSSALFKTIDGTLNLRVVKLAPLFEDQFQAKNGAVM